MTFTSTNLTSKRVAAIAAEVWGLRAAASPLGGWEDSNFELRIDDGTAFVLKVSPADTRREELENQVALLEHLSTGEFAPMVPRVVTTLDRRKLHRIESADGTNCWARLLTYLEGRRLVDVDERPPTLLDEIGRTLARLDLALKTFDHPASRRTHEWDPMATPQLAPIACDIVDPARRRSVEARVDRFSSVVLPCRTELEHGVIHADANDHNLLVEIDENGPHLSGIIDFSDALICPIIADLGICLAYLMLDRTDPFADAGHLIRGYHAARPLTGLERELLPVFVLNRVCASVLHAARGLARDPENQYLQVSSAPMWRLFETLDTCDAARFPRTVEAACS